MKLHYKGENPKRLVELQFAIATGKKLWINGYTIWTKRIANEVSECISVEFNSPLTTSFQS